MKNIAIILFVVFLITVLALAFCTFQVRETESALVTTFGKATRQITRPGWNFKWPPPIQSVYKADSRMRVLEADLGETTTKGAAPIIVNPYVVWRISNPLEFYNANSQGSIREAENKLLSQIKDTRNRIIGLHSFGEFVNSDPDKIQFPQIEAEMLRDLEKAISDAGYGIEIKTLGIKHLKINEDVTKKVFVRMSDARNRKTKATLSEGKSQALSITSDAKAKQTELMAAAVARATAIRGKGDAEAAKHYERLEQDPEFAIFLRQTEALKEMFKEGTTYLMSADIEPFRLLKEITGFAPKKQD
jgi:membrane protease subunit HflC